MEQESLEGQHQPETLTQMEDLYINFEGSSLGSPADTPLEIPPQTAGQSTEDGSVAEAPQETETSLPYLATTHCLSPAGHGVCHSQTSVVGDEDSQTECQLDASSSNLNNLNSQVISRSIQYQAPHVSNTIMVAGRSYSTAVLPAWLLASIQSQAVECQRIYSNPVQKMAVSSSSPAVFLQSEFPTLHSEILILRNSQMKSLTGYVSYRQFHLLQLICTTYQVSDHSTSLSQSGYGDAEGLPYPLRSGLQVW
ncbi:hypothetical protein BT96DRAFT_978355 [Gymnopus androsaceus JB14]|uniref:Uncharacterized protein n=1 Tax=Gymnopus androsaceus JB14 TaxID=1447944 RepID=A0A6A4H975_9AGAR|nr:hypothetical protein BT96DRAFT_978355 [Gymnopus androsaceus JB14]